MDDALICDLSGFCKAVSEMKPTKRNVICRTFCKSVCVSVSVDSTHMHAHTYKHAHTCTHTTHMFQDTYVAKLEWDDNLEKELLQKWKSLVLQM